MANNADLSWYLHIVYSYYTEVSGSSMTYGPNDLMTDGKLYRTLALHDGKLFVGGKAQLFSANPENLITVSKQNDMYPRNVYLHLKYLCLNSSTEN